MEAALTGKKPALPPRPDSSCSHTSSVTYLSRISQLELLNQELEAQLQASLAENLKLKEQLKRYVSEEGRWNAADLVIQELKKQLSVLTDENFTLNSTVTSQQAQITALQAIPVPALRSPHTKSRSLATDDFSRSLLSVAPRVTKDSVASVSVHIRDIRPALTEASTEDLHIQTVSLTEASGNHLPLQSFYKTAVRGMKDMENTRPMGSDRSGSATRLGAVAKYTPFSVRMAKKVRETPETHVNIPKVSEVKQGSGYILRGGRRIGGSVDYQ